MDLKTELKNGQIWFNIKKKDKTIFLNYAKNNGCKWVDGKEISPTTDECGCHMGITPDLLLGFVGCHCWFASKNTPRKLKFKVTKFKMGNQKINLINL